MAHEHLEARGRRIVGHSQARRRRLRETQQQVATLITARTRDHRDTLAHIERGITPDLEQLARVLRDPTATATDVRACFVSLAATALILAEEADCPPEHVLEGANPNFETGDDPEDYGFLAVPDEFGLRTATRCEDGTVLIRLLPQSTPVDRSALKAA